MTVDDVKYWLIVHGIGHIIASDEPSNIIRFWTLCDTAGNVGTKSTEKPKRICKRCREVVSKCFPGKDYSR